MKRALRIVIEVMTPPFLGAVLLGIPAVCFDHADVVSTAGLFLFGAYAVAGIPSLVYALAMEVAFTAGLDPIGRKSIALSAALGFLAGLAIVPLASGGDFIKIKTAALAVIPLVGLMVGVVVGSVIRWLEKRSARGENR